MFRRMPSGTANISHLQRFSWVPKGADIEPPLNVLHSLRLTNGKRLVMNASVNIRKLTVTMGAKAPILYHLSICSTKIHKRKKPRNAFVNIRKLTDNGRFLKGRRYCISLQYAPVRLTKGKSLGTPLYEK